MNNCVIDLGNTRIKAGIFENGELKYSYVDDNYKSLIDKLNHHEFGRLLISSVSEEPTAFANSLPQARQKIILDAKTPLPFENHYLTKSTLGNDRKAAVAGAQKLFASSSCLVIDIGSCITYDLLESGQDYRGGMISPGINIRLKGMHQFTGRLPLIENVEEVESWVGTTTRESMLSGVLNGIRAEINGVIEAMKSKKGELNVIMTGGDLLFFESSIKGNIFAVPEIVLVGLNAILEFNEK